MADYAIHDTTLISQANILRKKFGTNDRQDPADYADKMNLMGMLEEKTASGSIVTFSDGADDVPIKSWEVALPPSLDGYNSVTVYHTDGQTPPVFSEEYTADLGRTIYGGSVDVVNGTGTDGYGYIVFDGSSDENWGGYSAYNGYYIDISDMKSGTRQDGVCNQLTCSKSTAQGQTNAFWLGAGNKRFYVIGVYDSMGNTLEAFRAYLAINPLILVYPLATSTDFTFEPVEISSRLGNNTMWSDSGDTEVTYRASGTVTPVVPTLISKTITANGIYSAEDDGVDGYDTVAVNVPSVEPTVTPLNSPNAFLTLSGVTGTDVERTVRTETASSDGKYVFASDSTCRTNTGGGDGFIEIQKNGVSVVKQYMSANTTTDITIPDIDVEAGDEVAFIVGFENNHSSCNFQLYTGIAFVSEASAPSLLSMSNSNSSNELENELEEENE